MGNKHIITVGMAPKTQQKTQLLVGKPTINAKISMFVVVSTVTTEPTSMKFDKQINYDLD